MSRQQLATATRSELETWQAVCALLLSSGAVTQADLESAVSANDTPGQRLLNAIRAWGDSVVALYDV